MTKHGVPFTNAHHAWVASCLIACVVVSGAALSWRDSRPSVADWRLPLDHATAALAAGDLPSARVAWEDAYRAAMGTRDPEGLLAAGAAALRIGEAGERRGVAVAEARRLFLAAFLQAREREDAESMARAGEAFAELGDQEVAARAFTLAMALATRRGDQAARQRVAALMARVGQPRPMP
jgi:hypothetical protein